MAEFVEVMKQARKLCNTQKYCEDCPLCYKNNGANYCRFELDEKYQADAELERVVSDWAAEHPEPVYPSWFEMWKQLFPGAKNVPCPELYFGAECPDERGEGCIACKRSPIPAEIAEKLGIKPKEEK